jgi:hypothetical protein
MKMEVASGTGMERPKEKIKEERRRNERKTKGGDKIDRKHIDLSDPRHTEILPQGI